MKRPVALLALLLAAAATGAHAETPIAQRETLNGTLWTQRTPEFHYSAAQVYLAATDRLRRALLPGTASLEQEKIGHYDKLPPAIVLDIDETVLDNIAYQAWSIQQGVGYDEADFRRWIALQKAEAIPGAALFTRIAAKRGIKVFYVTNRSCDKPAAGNDPAVCPSKEQTMANMAALNFARAKDPSAFLFANERGGWPSSDKTSRRAWLAQKYRIVMLLGDDLKDILPGETVDALRKAPEKDAWKQYMKNIGKRWFVLPNPVYGSWERALPKGIEARYDVLEAAPLGAPAKAPK